MDTLEEILSSPEYAEWVEEDRARSSAEEWREAEWLERTGRDYDRQEA